MKTIKILFLLLAFSTVTFYSCSDKDPIENNTPVTQKSIALRTALNQMKVSNDINGKGATLTNPFCFEFVYPIILSYSNGTTVTVGSFGGLIELLGNESPSLYLNGIVFPFQVMYGGAVHTIHSETEFTELIINCGYNTYNIDLLHTYCFDLVYPFDVLIGADMAQTIHSHSELEALINGTNANTAIQVVYPISVTYNGQIIVIHNEYEFYQMVNNCNTTNCICTQEYAPVCVQTPTGIVEYGNMCYATCAGYTQNDLVPCNPTAPCSISNATATVGNCNTDGTYQLALDFDYANVGNATTFQAYVNGVVFATYPLSALPVTINFPTAINAPAGISISIAGTNCSTNVQWTAPNCGCSCPANFDPVCVQTNTGLVQYDNACLAICAGHTANDFVTCGVAPNNFGTQLGSCFNMVYPVQVQYQGALVTVNSDGELLQYYFPNLSPQPAMVYPITIILSTPIGPVNATVNNQTTLQDLIASHCN